MRVRIRGCSSTSGASKKRPAGASGATTGWDSDGAADAGGDGGLGTVTVGVSTVVANDGAAGGADAADGARTTFAAAGVALCGGAVGAGCRRDGVWIGVARTPVLPLRNGVGVVAFGSPFTFVAVAVAAASDGCRAGDGTAAAR